MIAIASRVMQFVAGPQTQQFFACADCRPALERGDVSCFLVIASQPVLDVDEADEMECDLCREGGD